MCGDGYFSHYTCIIYSKNTKTHSISIYYVINSMFSCIPLIHIDLHLRVFTISCDLHHLHYFLVVSFSFAYRLVQISAVLFKLNIFFSSIHVILYHFIIVIDFISLIWRIAFSDLSYCVFVFPFYCCWFRFWFLFVRFVQETINSKYCFGYINWYKFVSRMLLIKFKETELIELHVDEMFPLHFILASF